VEAGAVAQAFSPVFSVVSGGLACVVGALVLGALIPAVRHSKLFDADEEPGPGADVHAPQADVGT
jgi:hypothetical protein